MLSFATLSQPDNDNKTKLNTVSFIAFIKNKSLYRWLQDELNEEKKFRKNFRQSGPIWDDINYYKTILAI